MRLWKPLLCLIALTSCGTTTAALDAAEETTTVAPATTITETTTTVAPEVTISEVRTAADVDPAYAHAERMDPPTTVPPDPCGPEAQAFVNGLAYQRYEVAGNFWTAQAYPVVAKCLGWTQTTMDLYGPGILNNLIPGESVGCPLLMGTQGASNDCVLSGSGNGQDAGWFQITSAGWGRTALLCVNGFYCSWQSIIATPWDSMRAGLLLIMLQPTRANFPWSWDKGTANPRGCNHHFDICHDSLWSKKWVNFP